MTKMTLKTAYFTYGPNAAYHITHEALPKEIESDDFLDTARKCFAVASNASGGHPALNCKIMVSEDIITMNANGITMIYVSPEHAKRPPLNEMPLSEMTAFIEAMLAKTTISKLGNCYATQYGDAWKTAKWVAPEDGEIIAMPMDDYHAMIAAKKQEQSNV